MTASRPAGKGIGQRTVRVFRLGEEPRDDLSDSTTAEERLAILQDLSERAWALSGKPFPSYSRSEIPVRIVRAR
jgi:hypothetical protein